MTQAARGLPAALHEPPPLALAPRPACSTGDGNGATGITATGDASPLSRRAAAPRASSRTMLTTQRGKEYSAPQYCTSCRIGLTSRLASSGRRCPPLDSAPIGGIARAQRAILMVFSDQGGPQRYRLSEQLDRSANLTAFPPDASARRAQMPAPVPTARFQARRESPCTTLCRGSPHSSGRVTLELWRRAS